MVYLQYKLDQAGIEGLREITIWNMTGEGWAGKQIMDEMRILFPAGEPLLSSPGDKTALCDLLVVAHVGELNRFLFSQARTLFRIRKPSWPSCLMFYEVSRRSVLVMRREHLPGWGFQKGVELCLFFPYLLFKRLKEALRGLKTGGA
jgi:hypothetical protein